MHTRWKRVEFVNSVYCPPHTTSDTHA
jgi:hypothetical protein